MATPVATHTSKNFAEASKRSMHLYRKFLRLAPETIHRYNLGLTVPQVRKRITQEFAKHQQVRDVQAIDLLLYYGSVEYGELRDMFKTKAHVMQYFHVDDRPMPKTFLDKFLTDMEDDETEEIDNHKEQHEMR